MSDPVTSPAQPGLNTLLEHERKLIQKRRQAAGDRRDNPAVDAVGIALSGGGIRSATFCLGVFQGLAHRQLIGKLDYLSTVSGGGYFGSFFGRMFTRRWAREPSAIKLGAAETGPSPSEPRGGLRSHRPEAVRRFVESLSSPATGEGAGAEQAGEDGSAVVRNAEAVLKDNTSPPMRWLRDGGNYLTPGGSGDGALAAAVFTRNWVAVLVVMLVTLLALFLGGNLARAALDSWVAFHEYEVWLQSLTAEHWWWTPWFFVPGLALALVVVPVSWAYWLTQAADNRQFACVALANLCVIGFGALAWRLLPTSSFYWIGIALGSEALLALIWIWVMGAIRCRQSRDRRILPEKRIVLSILLVSLLPAGWRGLLLLQWRTNSDLQPWLWAVSGVLVLAGLHHLALRVSQENKRPSALGGWLGCWDLSLWRTQWPGMVCCIGLVALVPLVCTFGLAGWPAWWRQRFNIWGMLDIWALLSLLAALYFLAYQVLWRDEKIRREGKLKRPLLAHWLRSKLSRCLNLGLIVYSTLQLLVIINACGQSLYAVVTYSGGTRSAAAAITGLLGIVGLAPVARAVAIRVGVGEGKLRVPLQLSALGIGSGLALLAALSVSYLSHGIAWRWGCPVLVPGERPARLFQRLQGEWHRGNQSRATAPAATTDAVTQALDGSPGAQLYRRFFDRREVALNKVNLIEVRDATPKNEPYHPQPAMFLLDLGLSFVVASALTLFFGGTISFLNLSSFHSFYTARLVRAYQGASNQRRWLSNCSIGELDPDDDIPWHNYRPHEHGGPLHLVNVALNSTVSLDTDMQSTTAKGLNLCVGPAGLSFGHQHALGCVRPDEKKPPSEVGVPPGDCVCFADSSGPGPFAPSPGESATAAAVRFGCKVVEPLSLGSWVGISGAAFTTGLGNVGVGSGTSIGTSLLCGLFNVRLGYWWENQFSPSGRISVDRNLAVQRYLVDEFTGRFRMERRNRWYLSDGGHFENTAAYELIRRRVPFIILCDGGADPGGDFDDLANLVRRVRLDFEAEIAFLSDEELRQLVHPALLGPSVAWRARSAEQEDDPEPKSVAGKIGTLNDLRPQAEPGCPPRARAQATLAWVDYPNAPGLEGQPVRQRQQRSLLLVIKPGVTDDSPADVINYQRAHQDFPHQSTLDQFFDEAQWESYRKLGEQIALRIFEEKSGPGWCPRQMAPP